MAAHLRSTRAQHSCGCLPRPQASRRHTLPHQHPPGSPFLP
jgi:hypothetical protein